MNARGRLERSEASIINTPSLSHGAERPKRPIATPTDGMGWTVEDGKQHVGLSNTTGQAPELEPAVPASPAAAQSRIAALAASDIRSIKRQKA